MYRSALFILAVALAPACGRPPPLTAIELDRRAELLVVRGHWDDARQLVDRGLEDARARGDRAGEARLLLRRGRTLTDDTRHRGGDRTPALADLEAAHAQAKAVGDEVLLADTIDALGMHDFVHWFSTRDAKDLAVADQRFRAALAIRVRHDAPRALSESHFHVGLVHQMRGERDAAHAAFERALALATRSGDTLRMSHPTRHLGYLAELRHDRATAEAFYRQSLELFEQAGAGPGVPAAQVTLAEARYVADGNAQRALELLTRALDGATATQSAAYVAISSAAIARVHRDTGHAAEALRRLAAAVAAMDAIDRDEGVPEAYEQMALIHLLDGDAAAALADVERGLARRKSPRLEALHAVARARANANASASASAGVGQGEPGPVDAGDPVVVARRALAAGDPVAALDAAARGDDPDTLLLAARAVGPAGFARANAAASAMSKAQAVRFARVLVCPAEGCRD